MAGAFLRAAILIKADFSGAVPRETDFDAAILGWTIFGNTDIRVAKNIDRAHCLHPVSVGLDTLQLSRWQVPRSLLASARTPPGVIATIEAWAGRASRYHSCFLSHSSRDDEIVRKVYYQLRMDGVPCFRSGEDIEPGADWKAALTKRLKRSDRVLVMVSRNSLESEGVRDEMGLLGSFDFKGAIIPLKFVDDGEWKATKVAWATALRDRVQAINFADASKTFEAHHERLLAALKKPESGRGKRDHPKQRSRQRRDH